MYIKLISGIQAAVLGITASITCFPLASSADEIIHNDTDHCHEEYCTDESRTRADTPLLPESSEYVDFSEYAPQPDHAPSDELPAVYDPRGTDKVTPVRDQKSSGTCWAFGAIAAAEHNMIANGIADSTIDLSETHLAWFAYPTYNSPKAPYAEGGDPELTMYTLAKGYGFALEKDHCAPYDFLPVPERYERKQYAALTDFRQYYCDDPDDIKRLILEKGALAITVYGEYPYLDLSTHTLYTPKKLLPDHEMAIVGWDDNFSKDNFPRSKPEKDGAWICKNSAGGDSADGYVYLSYCDQTHSYPRSFEIRYITTQDDCYYQYLGDHVPDVARADESITAYGVFSMKDSTDYKINIYKNIKDNDITSGELVYTKEVHYDGYGYHRIELDEPIHLDKGEKFKVNVTQNNIDYYTWAYTVHDKYDIGETFYDDVFGEYVANNFDKDHDGMLSKDEAAAVKSIDVSGLPITSLFGIEVFSELTSLDCSRTGIMELDLSENKKLTKLTANDIDRDFGDLTCDQLLDLWVITKRTSNQKNVMTTAGILIPYESAKEISYTYDCGNGFIIKVHATMNSFEHVPKYRTSTPTETSHKMMCGCCYTTFTGDHVFSEYELLDPDSAGKAIGSDGGDGMYHMRKCIYCGYQEKALHTFDKVTMIDETYHKGVCRDCGNEVIFPHVFSSISKINSRDTHEISIADMEDGTHAVYCSCGYTDRKPHDLTDYKNNGDGTHLAKCFGCSCKVTEKHYHASYEYVSVAGHKSRCACNYVFPEEEHDFGEYSPSSTTGHSAECTKCKYWYGKSHEFVETNDGNICEVCGSKQGDNFIYGDINCDGRIDVFDMILMRRMILGSEDTNKFRADYNKDRRITVADLVALKKFLLNN